MRRATRRARRSPVAERDGALRVAREQRRALIVELRSQRAALLSSYRQLLQPVPVSHVLAVNAADCSMRRAADALDAIDRVLQRIEALDVDGAEAVRRFESAAQAASTDVEEVSAVVEDGAHATDSEQPSKHGRTSTQ